MWHRLARDAREGAVGAISDIALRIDTTAFAAEA
jgi:hypothetical protein